VVDGAGAPDVVEVQPSIPVVFIMFRVGIVAAEPGFVELFVGGRFGGFEAVDELAVGRLGVVGHPGRQGADRLHDEYLLLVVDAREVGDLAGRPGADADVDVLAGALRGLGAGFAQGADDFLQAVQVLVAEDGADHLGGGGAVAQAAVRDRLPDAAVGGVHRPGVVGAAFVADAAADYALDGLRRLLAAEVSKFAFGSEGQVLDGLDGVRHGLAPGGWGCGCTLLRTFIT
jgi:hypothetical protein